MGKQLKVQESANDPERLFRDQYTTIVTRSPTGIARPAFDRLLVALFTSAGVIAVPLGLGWLVVRCLP